jgi:hypothetical protein
MERNGRATHVTTDELRASGSKTWFALPDGETKFALSSAFAPAPGLFTGELFGGTGNIGNGIRVFPNYNQANGSGATANVTTIGNYELVVPYNPGTEGLVKQTATVGSYSYYGNQSGADVRVADETQLLVCAFFGARDGLSIEVDYVHNVEFRPSPNAPPGVEGSVMLPNSAAMDAIFTAAAVVERLRGSLTQVRGDATISAGHSHSSLIRAPKSTAEAEAARTRALTIARIAKGRRTMPVAKESFWDLDWLGNASFGKPGSGFGWDFSGKKSKQTKASAGRR